MTIRAVFFDIDGTLVDSNDMHVTAWLEAFGRIGKTFERGHVHDQIGKGTDTLVPTLLPDADEALQEQLGDAHGEVFKGRFLPDVRPFPKARALMERVARSGAKVVLASSSSKEEVEHYLHLLDAGTIVDVSTSSDDVAHTKPAPDIFAAALRKVAPLTADEILVLGDSPYDIEAAAKCGISAVALRSGGFDDTVLQQAGAVAIYDDVAALLADYERSPLHACGA